MTKDELARCLNGREYGCEITKAESADAKAAGLVVVFGASDDLIEFRGAIEDEGDVINGGTELILDGELFQKPDCDCAWAEQAMRDAERTGRTITALWCAPGTGVDWTYKTDIPHSTFDVMEDGAVYCRGIVFALSDCVSLRARGGYA